MKTVFVVDNVVVGYGMAMAPGVRIASSVPGAVHYEVADEMVMDVGWSMAAEEGGAVRFIAPEPVLATATANVTDSTRDASAGDAAALSAAVGNTGKVISPIEFKLLFTPAERIAIKFCADPMVQDFFSIVDDPRLTKMDLEMRSTQTALHYLVSKELITEARLAEIMACEFQ